jgi:hypothetical protein
MCQLVRLCVQVTVWDPTPDVLFTDLLPALKRSLLETDTHNRTHHFKVRACPPVCVYLPICAVPPHLGRDSVIKEVLTNIQLPISPPKYSSIQSYPSPPSP